MIASAISATVITLSQRAVARPPLVDRLLSLISVLTSVRASRIAGAKPTSRPVTTSAASANSSTRPSNVTDSSRGSFDAPSARSARTPAYATATPSTAPAVASSTDSVSSCRTMPSAAGAERDAHGHLARARRSAREQQVRHVHAREQEQQSGRRHDDDQDRTQIADDGLDERLG